MKAEDWDQARNIVCIRLDFLGDVIMCTPAIRAIRQSGTDRHITLLGSGSGAAAARFVPEIDTVVEYAAPWMKSSTSHPVRIDLEFIEMLRSCNFDAAVIFTTYSQSALPAALLCYLADIPLRLAHCRENPYQLLSHWVPDPEPEKTVRHEVRRQLDLVATVGCHCTDKRLSFSVPDKDVTWARDRLEASGIDLMQPLVLLHPGAATKSRRYPLDHWSQLAFRMTDELAYQVVLTGNDDDMPLTDEIKQMAPHVCNLAGELDLGRLGALISLASVLVSGNTGPAHIAAALQTPLVDLYALTNPQHTPWQVNSKVLYHDVPCRFCYKSICPEGHHDCLNKVAPEHVIQAVEALLQHNTGHVPALPADDATFSDGTAFLLNRISEALPGSLISHRSLQAVHMPPASTNQ